MKIFNKLAIVATMAAGIGFTSCQEELAYEVGAPAAQDSAVVYFADDLNEVVLAIDDSTFQVSIARTVTEAATYNLNVALEDGVDGNIVVPTTVTFEEGETETAITVNVTDIVLMQDYTVNIAIDEAWVNPYAVGDNTVLSFVVKREDFAPYAEGTYTDYFLYTDAEGIPQPYAQVLEYSPSTQMYRFKNCWGFGTDVLFTWDGAEKVVVKPAIVSTGYVHPSYGVITANYYNDYTYAVVDPETNAVQMVFAIEFTVAAGSFGSYYNTFEFVKPN